MEYYQPRKFIQALVSRGFTRVPSHRNKRQTSHQEILGSIPSEIGLHDPKPLPPDHIVIICLNLWSSLWLNHRSSLNLWVSLVAQSVKGLPTMQETQVQSLGQENPLEKEMATHSSTLAWKIPWTEEPHRLQCMGLQRVWHNWVTSLITLL